MLFTGGTVYISICQVPSAKYIPVLTKQSKAKQSKAKQSKAKQSKAKHPTLLS
jgi:hypothetical protein